MLVSHIDVVGSRWQYISDQGKLVQLIDPLGTNVLKAEYDNSRVVATTTIAGYLNYVYAGSESDGASVVKIGDALGNGVELNHNASGQVTEVKSLGNRQERLLIAYDDLGYRTSIEVGNKSFKLGYDATGRLNFFDNGKYQRKWTYSDDGRLTSASDVTGSTSYVYDANRQVVAANSSTKSRSYTAVRNKGKLAEMHGIRGDFSFTYTEEGRIASIFGPNNQPRVELGYDKSGFLVSERVANTYSTTARRNARGQLLEWADSVGRQFSFARDARGALVRITNTNGDWAQASRDSAGRIIGLTNSRGQSRSFAYDQHGVLTAWTDALQRVFQVEYDPATGVASQMTYGRGLSIVRNANGEAVLRRSEAGVESGQVPVSAAPDDGWMDPLHGSGLLGTFSGQTSYSAMEIVRTPSSDVPPLLAPMLQEVDGDGGDSGGGGDFGDFGGGDLGDTDFNGPGDDYNPVNQADCSACTTAYQISCENTRDSSERQAYRTADAADIVCGAAVVSGGATVVGLACLALVEATLQNALDNTDTSYDNCVLLISQNCWSRCH
jgi:YD repeat-containing protein